MAASSSAPTQKRSATASSPDASCGGADESSRCSKRFKGVRKRSWGKWVSEIRLPNTRARLWLGSYPTAEQAAVAFDVAVVCLRGRSATLNFPESPPIIDVAGLSHHQIQELAAAAALAHGSASPAAPPLPHSSSADTAEPQQRQDPSASSPAEMSSKLDDLEAPCSSSTYTETDGLHCTESNVAPPPSGLVDDAAVFEGLSLLDIENLCCSPSRGVSPLARGGCEWELTSKLDTCWSLSDQECLFPLSVLDEDNCTAAAVMENPYCLWNFDS